MQYRTVRRENDSHPPRVITMWHIWTSGNGSFTSESISVHCKDMPQQKNLILNKKVTIADTVPWLHKSDNCWHSPKGVNQFARIGIQSTTQTGFGWQKMLRAEQNFPKSSILSKMPLFFFILFFGPSKGKVSLVNSGYQKVESLYWKLCSCVLLCDQAADKKQANFFLFYIHTFAMCSTRPVSEVSNTDLPS